MKLGFLYLIGKFEAGGIQTIPHAPGDWDGSSDSLSPSEKQTLKHVAEGEYDPGGLDWLALQRLKRLGLSEAQSTGRGVRITKQGMRVLKGLG